MLSWKNIFFSSAVWCTLTYIFFNKGILYFFQVPMDTPATVNIDMGVRTNVEKNTFFWKKETSVYTVVLKKKKSKFFFEQNVMLQHVLSKPQCVQPFLVVPPALSFSRISSNPQSYIAKKNLYLFSSAPPRRTLPPPPPPPSCSPRRTSTTAAAGGRGRPSSPGWTWGWSGARWGCRVSWNRLTGCLNFLKKKLLVAY